MAEMNPMVKAFNSAIAESGIQIEIYRNDYCDEWKAKVDTSKHDAKVRADALDELVDKIKETDDYEFAMFSLGFIEETVEKLKEQIK